jgi:hypothetical protein
VKPGDRIRVTGKKHPWKGAVGRITRRHDGDRLDWYLVLDPPHGFPAYGRESAALAADLEPEDRPAAQPGQLDLFGATP